MSVSASGTWTRRAAPTLVVGGTARAAKAHIAQVCSMAVGHATVRAGRHGDRPVPVGSLHAAVCAEVVGEAVVQAREARGGGRRGKRRVGVELVRKGPVLQRWGLERAVLQVRRVSVGRKRGHGAGAKAGSRTLEVDEGGEEQAAAEVVEWPRGRGFGGETQEEARR